MNEDKKIVWNMRETVPKAAGDYESNVPKTELDETIESVETEGSDEEVGGVTGTTAAPLSFLQNIVGFIPQLLSKLKKEQKPIIITGNNVAVGKGNVIGNDNEVNGGKKIVQKR